MTNRRTKRTRKTRERRIIVRGVRRQIPDTQKLARALVALARAQAEAQIEAEHARPGPEGPEEGSP